MEHPLSKVRDKDDNNNDDDVCSDRISRLPDPVLHHILSFLSQKKALQTSVLSKSWRHLGPTRPVIDLRRGINSVCENYFKGNQESFLSLVDNTFQRYQDHNLFPKQIRIDVWYIVDSLSALQKWIPIFVNPDRHVTTFCLSFGGGSYFNLPSIVFKVESLQQLSLQRCWLNVDNFMLKNLQKLSLSSVYVSDEALENMISSCPLVKCVLLFHCHGFTTINIGIKNRCLNRFEFSRYFEDKKNVPSIEIEAPTLESIRIESGNSNWYPNNTNRNYFPHLKTLFLSKVNLPTHSFDNFSCNFPCLEGLSLLDCSGFEEINLSSRSITRLIINQLGRLPIKKLAIDVPNILYFQFSYKHFPTTVSLTTTFREWKSHLELYTHLYACGDDDVLKRILKLFEMLKALSQSRISLTVNETYYFKINKIEWDFNDHPVEVENLGLKVSKFCPDSFAHFVNALFRIFRPRYTNAVRGDFNNDEEVLVTAFLWKTLLHEREKTEYGWEQYLKEVSIETSDKEGKVWHHVQWTCLPEWSKNQKIRFRLKWKD